MIKNNNDYENINPQDFEFVKLDERKFDKKFETKPVGYFKDAMIRFTKNRTNVVATLILFILVLLSVFVPVLTTKNYTQLDSQLAYLPPRIPGLEKLGIFDGYRQYNDQTVDLATANPETGFKGYPLGFIPYYINQKTLEYKTETCSDRTINVCTGGQSVILLNNNSTSAVVASNNYYTFTSQKSSVLKLDVYSISGINAALEVLVSKDFGTNYVSVGTITTSGVHEINVFDTIQNTPFFSSLVQLKFTADTGVNAKVALTSIKVYDNTSTEPIMDENGYTLANYNLLDGKTGSYARQNGQILKVSFKYDEYRDAFADRELDAFSAEKYDALIAKYSSVCVKTPDPGNPKGWLFPAGCPVKKVISQSTPMKGPDGKMYFSYHLILDYAVYSGYDEGIPYFFFGTTMGGQDFFAALFLGLRTSLLIGLIVAAINITIGVVYGAVEGYYGGKVDLLMERFGEIIGRIPFLVWLSLFLIILGPGTKTLIVLLTVTGWLGVAGVTRSQFYRYKRREYVLASRTLGASDARLIFRHILPNGIGTIITSSILMIPEVIFAESTISYLGFGIGHGQTINFLGFLKLTGVSIGVLLSDGRTQIADKPYLTFFPAIVISILMITFNMFGNALRDAFNPSLRGSE